MLQINRERLEQMQDECNRGLLNQSTLMWVVEQYNLNTTTPLDVVIVGGVIYLEDSQ